MNSGVKNSKKQNKTKENIILHIKDLPFQLLKGVIICTIVQYVAKKFL